ncbi:RAP domain [Fragilaria crotonensis]|nr:RAP domain [Fragilaria crotonensis]
MFQNGKPQEIANCVWACAKLGMESPNLFRLMEERAEWLFKYGNQQEIASCIWACGTLGVESPNLFMLLDKRAEWLFEDAKPQEIANCAWACGALGLKSPNLFRLLDAHAEWLFENGNQQVIANCTWACGTLGMKCSNLFRLLDERAEMFVANGGSPQGLANCAWACAKLEIESPNLFRLLDEHAEWLVEHGSSQEIANCAYALAVLGSHSRGFFSALERCLNEFLADANSQDLCNVCYAIVVLHLSGVSQKDMLANLWKDLIARDIDDLPIEELKQVVYVQACASAFDMALASPSSVLQTQLDRVPFTTESSRFETTVSTTLWDIGFSHQCEISPFESIPGMLSIDLACVERRIAIECDGPSHYLSVAGDNEGNRLENGPTKAKRRLLQQLGWNVINLNWAEARQHQVSQEWLRSKLSDAGVVLL